MRSRPRPDRAGRHPRRPARLAVSAALVLVVALGCAAVVPGTATARAAAGWSSQAGGPPPGERLPEPAPTPEASRRQAEVILAKPEYQPPEKGVIEKVLEWIFERLGELFRPIFTAGGVGGGISPLMWIVLALLVLVAVYFLSRIRRGPRRQGADDDAGDALEIVTEADRSVGEWQREADRYEAEGRWKEGLLCRYRALVAMLIERGALRDLPGRTAGEYRVEFANAAPWVAGAFAGASELFERAWYGNRETGAAEAERFRELAAEVLLSYDRPVGEDREPAGMAAPG